MAEQRSGLSRRGFLGRAGAVGAGAVAIGAAGVACSSDDDKSKAGAASSASAVDFFGEHQAGIGTAAQDRLAFAAFDVTKGATRADVVALLKDWTAAAVAMTRAEMVGGDSPQLDAPPTDTGEAAGLPASQLTITVGFGPSLFDSRFGLAGKRPAALAPLPALPGDELEQGRSGGDIGVQACANDPQVAFHVIRNFARIGSGTIAMRWSQLGFGRTSSTTKSQSTPRNLMGFKDGTRNLRADDKAAMDKQVWVGSDADQKWMSGGSYAVTRRIRMEIEAWDRDRLSDQENVFGRVKASGAPLTGDKEFDEPKLKQTGPDGEPMIPMRAHIRLASPDTNNGIQILRRGYSYTDGINDETGLLDAGLFFIAYQRNAHEQFVPLQRRLGANDSLNEYITHTGSALFACPPGVRDKDDYFGSALFG